MPSWPAWAPFWASWSPTGLGYALYRGAVRINLGKFFSATSLVLVLVAAGLVMTSLHTAHEATWVNFGQQPMLNLTWLVRPGSVQAAVLTGMLGLQPRPTQIEVAGWVIYVALATAFILWPRRRTPDPRVSRSGALITS